MDNKKSNSKLIILLIMLIIIISVSIVVILLLTNKKSAVSVNNTTQSKVISSTTNNEKSTTDDKFLDFPKKDDDGVSTFGLMSLLNDDKVNLNVNFNNISLNKYNLNYTVSCTNYDESNIERFGYGCSSYQFKIGDLILEDFQDEGCGHINSVINVGNYFIIQHAVGCDEGCGSIDIYKDYQLLYTIKNTQIWGIDDLDGIMKYSNGKLYYFVTPDEKHISLKSIDLNSDEIVEKTIETSDYDYVYCNYD